MCLNWHTPFGNTYVESSYACIKQNHCYIKVSMQKFVANLLIIKEEK